jgi:outer membrane receptor protein involved in Fe transport
MDLSTGWTGDQGLWVQLAASLINGELIGGEDIPLLPPSNLRWTTGWQSSENFRISAVVTHSREATLVHASAESNIGSHLRVGISAMNLSNAEYVTVLSDLRNLNSPEAGRNIRLRLTWTL